MFSPLRSSLSNNISLFYLLWSWHLLFSSFSVLVLFLQLRCQADKQGKLCKCCLRELWKKQSKRCYDNTWQKQAVLKRKASPSTRSPQSHAWPPQSHNSSLASPPRQETWGTDLRPRDLGNGFPKDRQSLHIRATNRTQQQSPYWQNKQMWGMDTPILGLAKDSQENCGEFYHVWAKSSSL